MTFFIKRYRKSASRERDVDGSDSVRTDRDAVNAEEVERVPVFVRAVLINDLDVPILDVVFRVEGEENILARIQYLVLSQLVLINPFVAAGGAEVNLSNDAARAVFQHEILRAAPAGKRDGSDGERQNESRDKKSGKTEFFHSEFLL